MASYEDAWLRENDQTHRPGWVPTFFNRAHWSSTSNSTSSSKRSLNCRSYQNLTNQRRRKSVTMAQKNKSGLPELFYFALNARRLLISAYITQQEPRGSSVEFHISWPFVKLRLVLGVSTDVSNYVAPPRQRSVIGQNLFRDLADRCSARTCMCTATCM